MTRIVHRLIALVVVACLVPGLLPAGTRGDARPRPRLTLQKKVQQVDRLERQLREPFGPDSWYVIRITGLVTGFEMAAVRTGDGNWRPSANLSAKLESRTCKVQGSGVAAELIWQLQHGNSPVRYEYRAFPHEFHADAFFAIVR